MNSKRARALRKGLFEATGTRYNDCKYQNRVVGKRVYPHIKVQGTDKDGEPMFDDDGTPTMVPLVLHMRQIRLAPACGRALYKKSKKLLDRIPA